MARRSPLTQRSHDEDDSFDEPRLSRSEVSDRFFYAAADDSARGFTSLLEEPDHFDVLMDLCDDDGGKRDTLLDYAVRQGSLQVLQAWRQYGLNPAGWVGLRQNSLLHLLADAEEEAGVATAEWLLEQHGVPLNVTNAYGRTPLDAALERGNLPMATWFARRMAAEGLLTEHATVAPMPTQPALGRAWRLGALVDPRSLPREARSWLRNLNREPMLDGRTSLWETALTHESRGIELADMLRAEGVAVPDTLAFDLWDGRATLAQALPAIAWAREHGAAGTHPTDGRKLIDVFLKKCVLSGAHAELVRGERPSADCFMAVLDLTLSSTVLDAIERGFARTKHGPKPLTGVAQEWAALWDALPEYPNAAIGMDAPELLRPFFTTPRRPATEVGAWLARKLRADGLKLNTAEKSWMDMVKTLAEEPVVPSRRPRL